MKIFCFLVLYNLCSISIFTSEHIQHIVSEEEIPLNNNTISHIKDTKNDKLSYKICKFFYINIDNLSRIRIFMIALIFMIRVWNLRYATSIILDCRDFTQLLYATTLHDIINNMSLLIIIFCFSFHQKKMTYLLQIIYIILALLLFLRSYIYLPIAYNYSKNNNISSINLVQFLFLTYDASIWCIQLQTYTIFIASTITLIITIIHFIIQLISIFIGH